MIGGAFAKRGKREKFFSFAQLIDTPIHIVGLLKVKLECPRAVKSRQCINDPPVIGQNVVN